MEVVGQSYEGRDIRVAKVCKGGCGNKKAVWIDGGIHARFTTFVGKLSEMMCIQRMGVSSHSDLDAEGGC